MTASSTVLQTPSTRSNELLLQCPSCKAQVGALPRVSREAVGPFVCGTCLARLSETDGIWNALPPEREEHYRPFMASYAAVRAAEGRGSRNSEFYLALPEKDLSGKNQTQWTIRGRTFAYLESRILPRLERTCSPKLDVLDLGAGNCWLSYRLSLRGHRCVAVDLLINRFDGLGAAEHYRNRIPHLFPRFQAEIDKLPFASGQFDVAIFNASFHYSVNYGETLGEALRCLRRPGCLIIADTAWYAAEASGHAMLEERRASFLREYGFASDEIPSLEFLTDDRLHALEKTWGLHWQVHKPNYGIRWKLRPLFAKLRGRREPSRFRVFVAEVTA